MVGTTPLSLVRLICALALCLLTVPACAQSFSGYPGPDQGRCISVDHPSDAHFRNVTAPGDIRVLSTDEVILVNKRIPEATRVIFDRATSQHSAVVIVKDCSGTARNFVLTISGEIDAGEVTIDGNYGSQALRRVGNRWMIQ